MATHDYVLDNASGANFRADLNNALAAIVSNNSSSSEPSTKYAYQWWADTNTGLLKIRNSNNDGWITLLQLDGTLTLEDGTESAPALGFRDDANTGIFSSAADTLDVTCGGTTRGTFSSTGLAVAGNVSATTFVGNIDAVDGDFDGTLEADAITVAGVALNTVIAGVTVTTATNANHVSVADNESTNENNLIPFIEDASATGNVGLESDGDFTYNPSTGTVTATIFSGALSGNATTATTATNANHISVADNESTNENNLIPFIEDASATGNVGLESDGDFTYNPSTGTVTATKFSGETVLGDTSPQLGGTLDTNGNNISFADNIEAVFGTGNDSAVKFNGTDLVITTAGKIKAFGGSTGFEFFSNDNSDTFAKFIKDGSVELYEDDTKVFETTASGITVTGAVTDSKGELRQIPQANHQGGTHTLQASDAGKHLLVDNTVTIPPTSGVFSTGDAVTLISTSGSDISVNRGSGVTMYNAADGTNANRTLATRGIATVICTGSNTYNISGAGLT